MFLKLFSIVLIVEIAFCAGQLISFKDGKIGVNFGGYHAEAGLGGLLTGNAAHGGLSASAGTPFGQQAGAGIGGSLDGRSAGGAYAGASAGYGVGASAAIGGGLGADGGHGGVGAESHVGGVSKQVVKLSQAPVAVQKVVGVSSSKVLDTSVKATGSLDAGTDFKVAENVEVANDLPVYNIEKRINIQKTPYKAFETDVQYYPQPQPVDYRKFFDFGFFSNVAAGFGGQNQNQNIGSTYSQNVEKDVETVPKVVYEKRVVPKVVYEKKIVPEVVVEEKVVPQTVTVEKEVVASKPLFSFQKEVSVNKQIGVGGHVGSGYVASSGAVGTGRTVFDDIFNIPISTLHAVNRLVNNNAAVGGGITVQKHVGVAKSY